MKFDEVKLKPGEMLGPIKLMVRADREAGVIRAWFASMDDESQRTEVATLNILLADRDSQLFHEWVKSLNGALGRAITSATGLPVIENITLRPADGGNDN